MPVNTISLAICLILLHGCMVSSQTGTGAGRPIHPIRNMQGIQDTRSNSFIRYPQPSAFSVCHGHTCRFISRARFGDDEWKEVGAIFHNDTSTPEQERNHIRAAIALLEAMVGGKIGTAGDLGENIAGLGRQGQLDCVDESTNTTVYLTMLQNAGLLQWHTVEHRISRGIASLQVPHFTAVITDNTSGVQYAVDSWFLDNGQPPFIIPVTEWRAGWKP